MKVHFLLQIFDFLKDQHEETLEEEDLINLLSTPLSSPSSQPSTPSSSQPIYHGCSLLVLEYVVAVFGFCFHHCKGAKTSIEHLLQFIQLVLPSDNCAPKTYQEISQVRDYVDFH
jgi:hypothetical protein